MMKNFAQKIEEVGETFNEYCKYPDYDRILFKRVHNTLVIYY